MVQCSECGKGDWPRNFEPVLEQVEGCPACRPESFRTFPGP